MVKPAAPVKLASVEASVLSHATEDEGKVERALRNLLPAEVETPGLRVQRLSGHYDDPMVLMTLSVRGGEADLALRRLVRSLSPRDRRRLLDEAEDRVDKAGNMYIRLDKQRAYLGGAKLEEADPIRLKLTFRLPHGADPVAALRPYLSVIIDEAEGEPEGRPEG